MKIKGKKGVSVLFMTIVGFLFLLTVTTIKVEANQVKDTYIQNNKGCNFSSITEYDRIKGIQNTYGKIHNLVLTVEDNQFYLTYSVAAKSYVFTGKLRSKADPTLTSFDVETMNGLPLVSTSKRRMVIENVNSFNGPDSHELYISAYGGEWGSVGIDVLAQLKKV